MTPQPISTALRTIIASQNEIPVRWCRPIAPRTSSAAGTCTYQRDRSAMISFAAAVSSGLGIFRVTLTKNSCRIWTLRHPSRVLHSCSSSARARSCLPPAEVSCAYTRMFVSTNRRLPLMDTVPAPADVPARAKVHALAQAAKASLTGARIPGFLLDQVRKHPGQELRDRRATPGREHPGLTEILFGEGQGDVLVGHDPSPHCRPMCHCPTCSTYFSVTPWLASRSSDSLEEAILDVTHCPLNRFGQVLIVDERAELDVAVLRRPGEVGAGDEQETVIDGEELGVVPYLTAVERSRSQHGGRVKVSRDLLRARRAGPGREVRRGSVQVDPRGDLGPLGRVPQRSPQ